MVQARNAIGEALARARKRRGLSQRRLAELSEVSNTMIASIERGRGTRGTKPVAPSPPVLKLLADGLSKDLVDGSIDPEQAARLRWELMLAAGYIESDRPSPPVMEPRAHEIRRALAETFGDETAKVEQFLIDAAHYDPADKVFLLNTFSWLWSMLPEGGQIRARNAASLAQT